MLENGVSASVAANARAGAVGAGPLPAGVRPVLHVRRQIFHRSSRVTGAFRLDVDWLRVTRQLQST